MVGGSNLLFLVFILFLVSCSPQTYDYHDDQVILMQHESEGYYGCFGCGEILCIDPVMEMKQVEESKEKYCNKDFEIVE